MPEVPEYGMVPDREMAGAAASSLTGALALGVRPVAVRRTRAPEPRPEAKEAAPLQLGRVCPCEGHAPQAQCRDVQRPAFGSALLRVQARCWCHGAPGAAVHQHECGHCPLRPVLQPRRAARSMLGTFKHLSSSTCEQPLRCVL